MNGCRSSTVRTTKYRLSWAQILPVVLNWGRLGQWLTDGVMKPGIAPRTKSHDPACSTDPAVVHSPFKFIFIQPGMLTARRDFKNMPSLLIKYRSEPLLQAQAQYCYRLACT